MKKVLIGAAALVVGTMSAQAADLPRKAPVYKAPILQVYDWTGFYIGVNAGGSIGRDRTRSTIPALPSNETAYLSPAGVIGGGQIGYNVQFRNFYNLVLGVEADIQGSGQRDNYTCLITCNLATGTQTFNQKLDWFGTARARVGIATGPVLSYVTGGFAFGHVNTSSTGIAPGGAPTGTISVNENRAGYTFGSGVEAQLGGNWTGKIEYLYVNLGTQNAAGTIGAIPFSASTRIRDNIFRAGVNYGFGNNAGYVEPVRNWNGFYIGANAGSIIGRDRSNVATGALANPRLYLVPDGYLGGGQIGYNWQASAWVFGVEGDFQGSTAKDNKTCIVGCTPGISSLSVNAKLPWLATARGRIGYSVGSTLFYGTAGYAYGETKTTFSNFNGAAFGTAEVKRNKGGYVVGGGIESPLSFLGLFGPAWTAKTEYLYVDLGSTTNNFTAAGTAFTFTTKTQEHIFRSGINYNFNAPVVAKY